MEFLHIYWGFLRGKYTIYICFLYMLVTIVKTSLTPPGGLTLGS